jgi:hypothetical protein
MPPVAIFKSFSTLPGFAQSLTRENEPTALSLFLV